MKPYMIAVLAIILSPMMLVASEEGKTGTVEKAEKPTNLSDNFARAALLALKGILSDASTPSFENGTLMVNRHTSELLQAADVEIVSKDESEAYGYLHLFFMMHMTNNQVINTMRIEYETYITANWRLFPPEVVIPSRVPFYASIAVRNDPRFVEMKSHESACSLAIENRLRSRTWSTRSNECDRPPEKSGDGVLKEKRPASDGWNDYREYRGGHDPCSRLPEGANGCKDGKTVKQR